MTFKPTRAWGRRHRGERNLAGSKLTAKEVKLIRQLHAEEGVPGIYLSIQFHVSQQTISKIVRGKSWRLKKAGWNPPVKRPEIDLGTGGGLGSAEEPGHE